MILPAGAPHRADPSPCDTNVAASSAAPLALEGARGLDTPAETISRCTAVKAPAEPRYDEGSGRGANSSAPVGM